MKSKSRNFQLMSLLLILIFSTSVFSNDCDFNFTNYTEKNYGVKKVPIDNELKIRGKTLQQIVGKHVEKITKNE